jgi:hypothetical protein
MISFLQYLEEALKKPLFTSTMKTAMRHIENEPEDFQWNPQYLEKEFRESPLEKDAKAFRLFIPLGSPVKYRIIKLFDKYGLKLISYKTGKVVSPVPGATYPLNIGAVLTDLINNKGLMKKYDIVLRNDEDKKEAIELLRLFAKDNDNRLKDDGTTTISSNDEPKWVVISRHPYDVAGMSTGREWTSCQDLEDGGLCHYVPQDIAAGSIVAYLIKDSDRKATVKRGDVLRWPLSRILIKPYLNNKGETAFAVSSKQYTIQDRNPLFPIIVKRWVDDLNKKRGIKGSFIIHPKVYMGYQGGTQEISATTFDINDEGEMDNVALSSKNPHAPIWEMNRHNFYQIFDMLEDDDYDYADLWEFLGEAIELSIENQNRTYEFIDRYFYHIEESMGRTEAFEAIFGDDRYHTPYYTELQRGNKEVLRAFFDLLSRGGIRTEVSDTYDIPANLLADFMIDYGYEDYWGYYPKTIKYLALEDTYYVAEMITSLNDGAMYYLPSIIEYLNLNTSNKSEYVTKAKDIFLMIEKDQWLIDELENFMDEFIKKAIQSHNSDLRAKLFNDIFMSFELNAKMQKYITDWAQRNM